MSRDYQEFIINVKRKTGIDLSLYKEAQMKRRLESFYEKKGYDTFQAFFLAMNKDPVLLEEFLERMTINVSEFYRNAKRWEVLEKEILPELLMKKQPLRIWSAACSTGEEPYTIAMILSKFLPLSKIKVIATDIDENAIARAKLGVYPERSLNEVPIEIKNKYFKTEGNLHYLSKEIKQTVEFRKQNLLSDPFDGNYDLIVCRNVLIYFTEEAKNHLYRKFSQSLKQGGYLFVGSTEQIFNPAIFELQNGQSFFYKKVFSNSDEYVN
ncbi:CheR family methyltransferase [Cytobacillus purgationiresistens]|uniref:protein-glutamate O-methyltransferase n=1 Tax=Cytobacillus purgationiresistens TaxID=863449 RepID=A0ABU0AIJ2_9BACI|nr:protein-glutamate O-methyltransferase CheR [Cytobacillus purgationiresistens]MDQ0271079.1 chemotaxis protein methyltransferase CheR [Cytobacillus purgationiresistens]